MLRALLLGARTLLLSARDAASNFPQGAAGKDAQVQRDFLIAPVQKTRDYSAAWLNEPSLAITHRLVFDQHVLPMWDPWSGYGIPFAAAMQPQPFYSLTVIEAFHPDPISYDWYLVLRFFIAGFFAALFVRRFAGFAPALAAGIACMFSGYFMMYFAMPRLSVETLLPAALGAVLSVGPTIPRLVVDQICRRPARIQSVIEPTSPLNHMEHSRAPRHYRAMDEATLERSFGGAIPQHAARRGLPVAVKLALLAGHAARLAAPRA